MSLTHGRALSNNCGWELGVNGECHRTWVPPVAVLNHVYMIKFPIVHEGQEAENTHTQFGNGHGPMIIINPRTVRWRSCIQGKCENDNEVKGRLGLCFLIRLQNGALKEVMAVLGCVTRFLRNPPYPKELTRWSHQISPWSRFNSSWARGLFLPRWIFSFLRKLPKSICTQNNFSAQKSGAERR